MIFSIEFSPFSSRCHNDDDDFSLISLQNYHSLLYVYGQRADLQSLIAEPIESSITVFVITKILLYYLASWR